jgi:enoyl-CoA hydratase/carnithine racemase
VELMTELLIDRWCGALRVRFDSPERRNALGLDTVGTLRSALESEPATTLVLGSSDARIFSAGADIKVTAEVRQQISDVLYDCYRLMVTRPGPVIAVVEGAAVGGGAQLTTAADLRVGGRQARWQWVGPGHGLVVGGWILPSLVGRGRALQLTLTSRWVSADEAVAYGLLNDIHDDPWAETARIVKHLRELDQQAVERLKQLSLHDGLLDRLEAEQRSNTSWDGRAPTPAR